MSAIDESFYASSAKVDAVLTSESAQAMTESIFLGLFRSTGKGFEA
ncbi:hypothetical protein NB311A_03874 [Nitrobacter sp. Nb-311A]|nr:hypothetical protein NB311A_03874 [Nitrobacter sp. Nb-311A]